jgi:hypothetical protein
MFKVRRTIRNTRRNIAGKLSDSWQYWNNFRTLRYQLPFFSHFFLPPSICKRLQRKGFLGIRTIILEFPPWNKGWKTLLEGKNTGFRYGKKSAEEIKEQAVRRWRKLHNEKLHSV